MTNPFAAPRDFLEAARLVRVGQWAPRVLVAAWCGVAAVTHGLATWLLFGETGVGSVVEGWAIPFTLGMAGAALTSIGSAVHPRLGRRGTRAPWDRGFWACLLLAGFAAALPWSTLSSP